MTTKPITTCLILLILIQINFENIDGHFIHNPSQFGFPQGGEGNRGGEGFRRGEGYQRGEGSPEGFNQGFHNGNHHNHHNHQEYYPTTTPNP
ncbi:hypothetical protein ACQ4LE_009781 [Meloidogyne hapla]